MDITIRGAVAEDFPAIDMIWNPVDRIHVEAHPEMLRPMDTAFRLKRFTDMLASGSVCVFVAEHEGAIVGFVAVKAIETPPAPVLVPRMTAYVDIIAVEEHVRDQGIGRLLMQGAERWAQDQGCVELELDVFEFNSQAIAFYESFGMRTKSRRMMLFL